MKACWIGFVRSFSIALVTTLAIGCGGSAPPASIPASDPASDPGSEVADVNPAGGGAATLSASPSSDVTPSAIEPPKNLFPEVVINTSVGAVRVRLNAERAPVTVENFLENYVDRGFYSNTIFHHVDPGYILAGGYTPELEPKEVRAVIRNEAANGLKNIRGTVTMSRMPDYADSATSQFFINVTPAPSLDYDEASGNAGYCVFGEVVDGMDVVDQIAKAAVHASGDFPQLPVETIVITSIERVR